MPEPEKRQSFDFSFLLYPDLMDAYFNSLNYRMQKRCLIALKVKYDVFKLELESKPGRHEFALKQFKKPLLKLWAIVEQA